MAEIVLEKKLFNRFELKEGFVSGWKLTNGKLTDEKEKILLLNVQNTAMKCMLASLFVVIAVATGRNFSDIMTILMRVFADTCDNNVPHFNMINVQLVNDTFMNEVAIKFSVTIHLWNSPITVYKYGNGQLNVHLFMFHRHFIPMIPLFNDIELKNTNLPVMKMVNPLVDDQVNDESKRFVSEWALDPEFWNNLLREQYILNFGLHQIEQELSDNFRDFHQEKKKLHDIIPNTPIHVQNVCTCENPASFDHDFSTCYYCKKKFSFIVADVTKQREREQREREKRA